jgi:hypothetical protein
VFETCFDAVGDGGEGGEVEGDEGEGDGGVLGVDGGDEGLGGGGVAAGEVDVGGGVGCEGFDGFGA